MAYAPNNLRCIAGPDNPGGDRSLAHESGVMRLWTYKSTDAPSTVRAANYFTDALLRGMRAGDIVFVAEQSAAGAVPTSMSIMSVLAVVAAGADLADATVISVVNS